MKDYFLITYFLVNFFLVGGYFFSRIEEVNNRRQAISLFLATLLLLVIAIPMAVLLHIYDVFQVRFFFKFIFTNKFDNIEEYMLKRFNRLANTKDKSKLSDRIYIYGVKLMNKRNNYVYVESEDKGELYSEY